jgi:hypothetical protein
MSVSVAITEGLHLSRCNVQGCGAVSCSRLGQEQLNELMLIYIICMPANMWCKLISFFTYLILFVCYVFFCCVCCFLCSRTRYCRGLKEDEMTSSPRSNGACQLTQASRDASRFCRRNSGKRDLRRQIHQTTNPSLKLTKSNQTARTRWRVS